MDVGSIASAAVYAQKSQTNDLMALAMTKQAAQQGQAMANMILQAAENAKQMAATPPPGQGQSVDIRA